MFIYFGHLLLRCLRLSSNVISLSSAFNYASIQKWLNDDSGSGLSAIDHCIMLLDGREKYVSSKASTLLSKFVGRV